MTPRDLFRTELPAQVLDALVEQGATFTPLEIAGDLAGAALLFGTEVHFIAHPNWREGRLGKRRIIRQFLAPILAGSELGFLTTRVKNSRENEQDFVTRIGFKKLWTDGVQTFFILSELPFSR